MTSRDRWYCVGVGVVFCVSWFAWYLLLDAVQ